MVHLQTLLREAEEVMAVQCARRLATFFVPPRRHRQVERQIFGFGHCDLPRFPDGTCRYKHACDKWVSDKGPAGHCFGAHPRAVCTNPNSCDAEQQ